MTMIRINLIAEKKATSGKGPKKAAAAAGGGGGGAGRFSEIQDNLIIVVAMVLALVVVLGMRHVIKKELNEVSAENRRLTQEWDEVKHWQAEKETYEIRKLLLNEKINKISSLKDTREGPVTMLEDLYNILPDSVWVLEIKQGYNAQLVTPTKNNRTNYGLPANLGRPVDFLIVGRANSPEAMTNFTNKLRSFQTRYRNVTLNNFSVDRESNVVDFNLYFEIIPNSSAATQGEGG